MPSGMGGLVRYFDEYKSRIQLKPEYIVLFVIALLAFEIIVRI
jgi:preprotein translocase subunit Sec61beta